MSSAGLMTSCSELTIILCISCGGQRKYLLIVAVLLDGLHIAEAALLFMEWFPNSQRYYRMSVAVPGFCKIEHGQPDRARKKKPGRSVPGSG